MKTSTVASRRRSHKNRKSYRKNTSHPKLSLGLLGIVFLSLVGYTLFRSRPGEAQPDLGNTHIEPPATYSYNTTPPTSGSHYGYIADWGIHKEPIANEVQVHNLEDGGVMVQYRCDVDEDCDALVEQLSRIVEQYPTQVILAPYPEMDSRLALTAWTVLDVFDAFDETRIIDFIEEYRGIDHH